jgi:transcriptional regulator with XRE-family HTH domain
MEASRPESPSPPGGTQESFGALLRHHRLAAGLSQEQLAERAGLSVHALSALEGGKRQTPYRHTVTALVRALGLTSAEAAALEVAVKRGRAPHAASLEQDEPPGGAVLTLVPEPAAAGSNLPLQPTSFIGRERGFRQDSAHD